MKYLTERELAERWRLSPRTIRQMRADGRLDHMRFGRRVVYPVAFVEVYEREQLVAARTVTLPTTRRSLNLLGTPRAERSSRRDPAGPSFGGHRAD